MSIPSNFNPNDVGVDNGNLFGLPFSYEQSELFILPVPWDVTVSYGGGTAHGPEAVLNASVQVDLYDLDAKNFWEKGIYMPPISEKIATDSKRYRTYAHEVIQLLSVGENAETNQTIVQNTEKVNEACETLRKWVFENTDTQLKQGKKVALLGGDHSTPLGFIQALGNHHESFGILQIDAHCDLRKAYEGFTYSHASVMYNALESKHVSKLVQVGIRDFCEEEKEIAENSNGRVSIFYDRALKNQQYEGTSWKTICENICAALPQKVYISFDIDGLLPALCPNTGTPVAGGLEVEQVFYLFKTLKNSGREIIGFDLNEVGNDEWDGNVGARVLYRLCSLLLT